MSIATSGFTPGRSRLPMHTLLCSYMVLLVLLTAALFTIFFYRYSRNNLFEQIDAQLLAAAHFSKAALPADFHDRLRDAKSLPAAEYEKIVDRHNQICAQLGMQYLWSCLKTGGDIVFTTATSPSKDVRKGDHAKFFDVHRDPHSFDRVFGRMEVDYNSFHNEWGHGRMVLVPFRDAQGRPYCFGASMSVDDVFATQRRLLFHTITLGTGVLAVGLLGTLLLARLLARPVRQLTASAERITQGNLTEPVVVAGPAEIGQLAEALNTMRLAIADKMNALSRREEDQRLLLQNLSAAVVIHAPDTRITYSNPMASTLLGLKAEQLQGKQAIDPAWRFVRDDDTPMPLEDYPVNRVVATRQSLGNYLLGINRPDQPERTWVLVNAFPELEEGGALRQVVVTFVDVTTIKRLERQLLQAQKMEAIGQLAGGVAHDFNNILQAINGYTELATEVTDSAHPAQGSLREIAKAAERAGKLVGQLLAFSRRQILEPIHLDLNDVVGNLIGMLGRVIGEHIRLDFIPGHQLGTVRADRTMVEQVLLNLSVNARDAMAQGGRLTLETENVCFDSDYCEQNLWARPGRYVLLSVTDTGCGMDATTLEHIFEPFFTTKETGKGTGLGLSMVYGIVRQHEGMVRVYSEVGKGTTFKIYLPVIERPADAVGSKIAGAPPRGTETILVAEDDASLRELARHTLVRAGYSVLTAADGVEALAVFAQQAGRVQFLLLDVVMPELGGREVFDRIHAQHPHIPALFASGYSENAIHTNFVLQEDMQLIRKPYDGNDLLRRVRTLLDKAALLA